MLQEVNFSFGGPFAFKIKMKYCAPTITRDMQKNPSKYPFSNFYGSVDFTNLLHKVGKTM